MICLILTLMLKREGKKIKIVFYSVLFSEAILLGSCRFSHHHLISWFIVPQSASVREISRFTCGSTAYHVQRARTIHRMISYASVVRTHEYHWNVSVITFKCFYGVQYVSKKCRNTKYLNLWCYFSIFSIFKIKMLHVNYTRTCSK